MDTLLKPTEEESDIGDTLNHFFDPDEFPFAYCGVNIESASDCPAEAVNCVVCLDINASFETI